MLNTEKKNIFPWDYFLLAFGFTWFILFPGVLESYKIIKLQFPNILLVAVAQFGPSLAAFYLTFRKNGKAGVLSLIKQALNFHIPFIWTAIIFLLPLVLSASAWLLVLNFNKTYIPSQLLSNTVLIIPSFLMIFLFQGPIPEEFGWRGYALPRLTEKFGFMKAALLLGVIWAFWHLPGFFMEGVSQSGMPIIPYFITVVALSVIIAWIYYGTGRNLLAALLTHTMFNLSIALFPPMEFKKGADISGFIYLSVLYVIAAFVIYSQVNNFGVDYARNN